jgi:hypothetical protein
MPVVSDVGRRRWYLFAVAADGVIVDGPWGYDDDAGARASFAGYEQRVRSETSYGAFLREAEDLDALIAHDPATFRSADGHALLRGARALSVVDRRARMFTPHGLAPSAPMHDEDVLVLVQQRLRELTLPVSAPAVVRNHMRALADLALYAAFAYDFNAFVLTMSALAHELVLGVKFIELHPDGVPLTRLKTDETALLRADLFSTLANAMQRDGRFPWSKNWRLRDHLLFRPNLAGLVAWAHARGLFTDWLEEDWTRVRSAVRSVELTRQGEQKWTPTDYNTWDPTHQSEWWQTAGRKRCEQERLENIAGLRNVLAHPSMHAIASPVDAISALDQLRKFIAVLWPEGQAAR